MKKIIGLIAALSVLAGSCGTYAMTAMADEESSASTEAAEESSDESSEATTAETTTTMTSVTAITTETETTAEESSEDTANEVTEEDLYNSFVAAYGVLESVHYGDFDGDGELDAYVYYQNDDLLQTYLVTADSITMKWTEEIISGESMGVSITDGSTSFECAGYTFQINYSIGANSSYKYIDVDSIVLVNSDGSTTAITVDGASSFNLCYVSIDGLPTDPKVWDEYPWLSDAFDAYFYFPTFGSQFTASGDTITFDYFFSDAAVHLANLAYLPTEYSIIYSYDAANYNFVQTSSTDFSSTSSSSDSTSNSSNSTDSSTSSSSSTSDTSSSPATGMHTSALIPVTITAAGFALLLIKKQRTK